ncbi:hypothetical protein Acid345_0519 [Candidatus Koribacter versatilis Ellin345]|uniref:Porin n=1 Tax=Koribacter versatilis (strain Ellin345) TaxID=204669 RepID=Q1IUC6_KORVE|nr:hypothetical protein [Candidatus Koribacter versatilis]ABF39524.1 hypothetical protein Acid345_0519 [Candidatus Koribacter versatilis Ellin345]
MRRMAVTISALLFCVSTSLAQQNATTDPDLQELKQQLRDVVSSLQETRSELKESQRQIQALQTEVASLRATNAPPSNTPSASPETTPTSTELADRVTTLQEQQALLSTRVDQQYQTKVESGSKYRVRLSGMVLFNASGTRGEVDDQDVPMLAEGHTPGHSGGNISATMRQTFINLDLFGPDLAGARTSASMQFDFMGGFPNTLDGVAMGIVRMKVAKAQLDWQNWSLSVGQDKPFISPYSPTSLATIGTPSFGYSGNLWTWTPQIVAERRWKPSESLSTKLQFGMLDPLSGELPGDSFGRYPESGERSRVPAFAARQSFDFGSGTEKSSIGFGGYYARHDFDFNRTVDGWAATLDWKVALGRYFEDSGAFYRGRAVGGLWGGIGTTAVMDGYLSDPLTHVYPVNSIGGWSQLKYKPAPKWEINAAFGEDSPFAADLRLDNAPYSYRPYLRNWTTMFNVIQRPRSNLMFSLEYRHLNSVEFSGQRDTAEHVNLGVGVIF